MAADKSTSAEEVGAAARADLVKVEAALTEFDKIGAGLAALRTKYAGVVYDVKTSAGMKLAAAARTEIRAPRYATETARKAAKAPVLALGRNIDERAAWIVAELMKIESPIDAQIKAEEERKEAEREAQEKAERERLARIQAGLEELKQYPLEAAGKSAAEIAGAMDRLELVQVRAWAFEFTDVAEQTKVKSMNRLLEMHTRAAEQEAETARLAAERAEFERQRAEQDERARADAVRIAEETRKREAGERERLDRIAAEERAAKDRIAAAEREAATRREEDDREARERRERSQAAMSEIQGIQQQVIIAQVGRAGVRVGGTIQCIEETLAETEAWAITEESFGIFMAAAQGAKDKAVAEIRALLAAAKAREEEAARLDKERERMDAERLAQEERERREREAAEAADREQRRKEAEVMDARALLLTFKERFGHLKQFAGVVRAIDAYIGKTEKAKATA